MVPLQCPMAPPTPLQLQCPMAPPTPLQLQCHTQLLCKLLLRLQSPMPLQLPCRTQLRCKPLPQPQFHMQLLCRPLPQLQQCPTAHPTAQPMEAMEAMAVWLVALHLDSEPQAFSERGTRYDAQR